LYYLTPGRKYKIEPVETLGLPETTEGFTPVQELTDQGVTDGTKASEYA
jgi:hypothetical protein